METAERDRWARRAGWLVVATLSYNVLEAGVALWAAAAAASVALLGFGLDSAIEVAAGLVALWRIRLELRGGERAVAGRGERRAHRLIGVTFLLLAAYIVFEAVHGLLGGGRAEESVPGIVLAAASLFIMPALAWAKLRAAARLGSRALRAEAHETLACAWLSLALLLGLGLNAVVGWTWADPLAALLMVPWLLREGWEGYAGEEEDEES